MGKIHIVDSEKGKKYGSWTVLSEPIYRSVNRNKAVLCECVCGTRKIKSLYRLKSGESRSCGCANKYKPFPREEHGKSRTRLYSIWKEMRSRCQSPKETYYKHYGGRGIEVIPRWESFSNFAADMGYPEPGMTLDRIDNNGNYEPGNCRWATRKEQQNNKRNNYNITYEGVTKTITEWAERIGISATALKSRIKYGWPLSLALTSPAGTRWARANRASK